MSVSLCRYYWANNFVSWFFTYILTKAFSPDSSCFSQKLFLITIYYFNLTCPEISQQPSFFLETLKILFLLYIILKWISLCIRLFLFPIICRGYIHNSKLLGQAAGVFLRQHDTYFQITLKIDLYSLHIFCRV